MPQRADLVVSESEQVRELSERTRINIREMQDTIAHARECAMVRAAKRAHGETLLPSPRRVAI